MPRQIPYYDLLFHVLRYLLLRQVGGRPTTLYQLSKRMGYGVGHIQGLLEAERVEYVLVSHGEKLDDRTTEILVKKIPQTVVVELGIDNGTTQAAFNAVLGEVEPLTKLKLPDSNVQMADLVDPVAKYRIQERTLEILKSELLSHQQLSAKLVRKGYPKNFVFVRLVKARLYEELSPVWRPFYYGTATYFLKKCLRHLHELTPFLDARGQHKFRRNKRKMHTPENPELFKRNSV